MIYFSWQKHTETWGEEEERRRVEHRERAKAEEGDGEMFLQSPGSQNEALEKTSLEDAPAKTTCAGTAAVGDEINMFVTVAKPLILLFSFSALLSLTHAHMGMYVIAFVVARFPILTQKIAPLREEGGCYLHLFKLILSR